MLFSSPESHSKALHSNLAKHNLARTGAATPSENWEGDERSEFEYRILEGHYIEELRASIQHLIPESIGSGNNFISWFESLEKSGPGQDHFLLDWLANDCSLQQMKWFLTQEVAAEAGFENWLACTQIKLPMQAKLECARNYWDEMGRGKPGASQAVLLERMVCGLNLQPAITTTVWESLALNNTMLALANTSRYAYHSLGALGIVELTSSSRARKISHGMKRLGMDPWVCSYYDLHAALNIAHSRTWIKEIICPLLITTPENARFIAEGAMMRLQSSQLCLERYAHQLGLTDAYESLDNSYTTQAARIHPQAVMTSLPL